MLLCFLKCRHRSVQCHDEIMQHHYLSKWCCVTRGCPLYIWSPPWWCHQMETFSALLSLCAENSPVLGEFPRQVQWRRGLMSSLIFVGGLPLIPVCHGIILHLHLERDQTGDDFHRSMVTVLWLVLLFQWDYHFHIMFTKLGHYPKQSVDHENIHWGIKATITNSTASNTVSDYVLSWITITSIFVRFRELLVL